MEQVDIYSKEGRKTGKVITKNEAHKQGIWHKTIHIWLINQKRELLIQKRAPEKDVNPNKWGVSSVGGHINAGETSLEATIRETREEIGIKLNSEKIKYLFTTPHQLVHNGGLLVINHLDDCFLAEIEIDPSKLTLQPEEVSEVKLIHFIALQDKILQKHSEFAQHEEYIKLFPLLKQRYG